MTERESLFYVVSDLALAIQGASTYPENHPKVQELLVRLHRRVSAEAETRRGLNIGIFRDHVVADEHPFLDPNPTLARLIERMQDRGIEKILFSAGITFGELKRFVYFLGDGAVSPGEQRWESISYGRVEGTGAADGASLLLTPPSPQSNVLAGATEVLKEVLFSLANERKRSRIEEGRDIVSSIMTGLRKEGMLIDRLIRLQFHNDYTVTHSLNVCILVVGQALQVGLPERHVREVGLAALLHDIGKEMIPAGILNKSGRLNAREFEEVKKHPLLGAKILRRIDCGSDLPMIVAFEHHIKYDRTGYPRARSSDPLHVASYLTQIADVYDALRTDRPYRPCTELEKTFSIMNKGRGTEFEPRFLDDFFGILAREEESSRRVSEIHPRA
jgi:putative nucleotidyltransferase with HDIG domain